VQLDVAFTPKLLTAVDRSVCVVVDVLRASTSCVTLFQSGIESIAVAEDPESARRLRDQRFGNALLCGEVGGIPPAGFDYGNSPVEFSRLRLAGRNAVLVTSNGTKALHAVSKAPSVLIGCLRNRAAVARFTARETLQSDSVEAILIVCAGNAYGESFSLDDAVTAGAIAEAIAGIIGAGPFAGDCTMTDAAQAAVHLYDVYARNPAAAFEEGSHGRLLRKLGFGEDLDYCSTMDVSNCIPYLSEEEGGVQVLRARQGA
jgi:2-phosphosulfolactate phosphatase